MPLPNFRARMQKRLEQTRDAARERIPAEQIVNQVRGSALPPGGNTGGGYTPAAHASAHQHGGGDEVATATPTANAIPKAGGAGTIADGWVPDLDTSKLTTGQLALARGGTNADLSATGGANQIVRQNSAGGAFSVSALAAGDIPALDSAKITSGEIPRSPLTTRGDLLTRDATVHARVAIGASGRYLRSNATDPSWGQLDMGDAALGTLAVARGGNGVAAIPSFSVHKNGTDQTITNATWTKVTWSTEVYDTNSNFASDKFTPTVAGTYLFVVSVTYTTATDLAAMYVSLYKNGVVDAQALTSANGTGVQQILRTFMLAMNGSSDYIEIYTYQATGGNRVVGGVSAITFWQGLWVAP